MNMATLTIEQRRLYERLIHFRDEVAYCYSQLQSAKIANEGRARADLATARLHFGAVLDELINNVKANPCDLKTSTNL